MALPSLKTEPVGNESLEKWESVGSGGFGHVYKARHKDWGFDVAIKILRDGVCGSYRERVLCEEINHMGKASCEFVLRVYGIYHGCPPLRHTSTQQGIVMEFMERGSIESLQKDLPGPPPWPLAFRLAHQVALGMNFLHSRTLMHHDLKPSNVLLSGDLHAKLADFGLSRVSTSVLNSSRETGEGGGSYKYMPPEAFEASYKPVRAFDTYSYGILLWSIVTGEEPYPSADYALVALRIPLGDRPRCEDIDQMKAEGLKELVELMKRCWDASPSERPIFKECIDATENVLSKHKRGIYDAVHQVLTRLESPTGNRCSNANVAFGPALQTPAQSQSNDTMNYGRRTETERSSIQDSVNVSTKRMSDTDKGNRQAGNNNNDDEEDNNKDPTKEQRKESTKFVVDNMAVLIQDVSEVMPIVDELGDMVRDETYSMIEAKQISQQKLRVLYQRTLRSEDITVKAAFYDALKKHQPRLVERLGG